MLFVKDLKLNNFRCFKTIKLDFQPNVNILVGENGCGKTSIVEAISYLCLGKSFKGTKDKEVLKFNEEYFNIISNISSENDTRLVIGYDGIHKRITNGETICKTLSEHVGLYKLISFCPDDLDVIKGSPSSRRQLIDTFISQIDNYYLKYLSEYKKILKIRNEFLKNIENGQYDKIMFDVINKKLISNGKEIIKIRKKYIEMLNKVIKNISLALTNKEGIIDLCYCPDVEEEYYEKTIINNIKIDLLSKLTTKGPQKDDINICFNGKEAALYASQGQTRIVVLSIKLAIYELFSNISNNIIVILDDVFSELDNNKQIYLMEYIKNVGQAFITTTEIDKIPTKLLEVSKIIEIREGENNV